MTREEINAVLDMKEFVGRAPEKVVAFIENDIDPVLARNADKIEVVSDVRV